MGSGEAVGLEPFEGEVQHGEMQAWVVRAPIRIVDGPVTADKT